MQLFIDSSIHGVIGEACSLEDSPPDANLSIDATEEEIRKSHKLNSNALIQCVLFMLDTSKCQLLIPFCTMIAVPLVKPILQSDIRRLEQDF